MDVCLRVKQCVVVAVVVVVGARHRRRAVSSLERCIETYACAARSPACGVRCIERARRARQALRHGIRAS